MILGSETRSLFPRSFTPLQLPDHLKENSIAALSSAQRVGKLRDFWPSRLSSRHHALPSAHEDDNPFSLPPYRYRAHGKR